MDSSAAPPPRILVQRSTPIAAENARSRLDAFLADFEVRTATKGGDSAITMQLQKLSAALSDETRRANKEKA